MYFVDGLTLIYLTFDTTVTSRAFVRPSPAHGIGQLLTVLFFVTLERDNPPLT